MEGRYHVSPNAGNDLNANNLETYIKDPANGLVDAWKKYPLCVCMTPRSRFVNLNGGRWEEFTFNLYFVCPSFTTGENQVKSPDPDTNTSTHHIWYTWSDMKACAESFLEVLHRMIRTRSITEGNSTILLRSVLQMEISNAIFSRLSNFNNDKLTGVSMAFMLYMAAPQCAMVDYPELNVADITMPPLDIHPLHKQ